MKKALCAAGFGAADPEVIRRDILPLETAAAAAFPQWQVCRAFTSSAIVEKLRAKGETVQTVSEAIHHLKREGFDEIRVLSTHVFPGGEYEKLRSAADGIKVSPPLIADESDIKWMAGLLEGIAREAGCPVLAAAHGADPSNDIAAGLCAGFGKYLREGVFFACIQGKPGLDDVIPVMEKYSGGDILILPMMIAAGHHARKELAGEGPESWKKVLTDRGFNVRVCMLGLGGRKEVQERFMEKAEMIL